MKKVIVGLSGGVDSSVAAYLLKQAGYHVEGLFMKNWEDDDTQDYCSSEADLKDVRQVCKRLDIKLHTVNFAYEYWQRVFSHFLEEVQAGRTPNPDILCNQEIKFKEFLKHALNLGADYIATGHYAGVAFASDTGYQLLEAQDHNKDQTYFLYTLGQKQLEKTLFPVAQLTKPEIRAIAKELDLITHNKKDSTGICFIGERRFNHFLQDYLVGTKGPIVTPEGTPLGEHPGLIYYTLGQRKGLYIGGQKGAKQAPWYVVGKDVQNHRLIVSQDKHDPLNLSQTLKTLTPSWICVPQESCFQAFARVRYRQVKQPCTVHVKEDHLEISFDHPQEAVTPGQSVVLYQETRCLGGAIIAQTDSLGGLNCYPSKSQQGTHHGTLCIN